MNFWFTKLKELLEDLGVRVIREAPERALLLAEDPDNGLVNCLFDASGEMLLAEQAICPVPASGGAALFAFALKENRRLPHGSFALDEDEKLLYFRDTIRFQDLDKERLEGTLRSLEASLSHSGKALVELSRG